MIRIAAILATALVAATQMPVQAGVVFVNALAIPGESVDLTDLGGGAGGADVNRLGMFSDLFFDRASGQFFGLGDRGPGGGALSYNTRVQQFSLNVDLTTGAVSNFTLTRTVPFTSGGASFNGQNPLLLNGNKATLGLSHDPEGFVVGKNGNHYVSDEYGPSIHEFNSTGTLLRTFSPPDRLLPKDSGGTLNYVDGRPTIVKGRQDNRGYEGLTMTPDGKTLVAVLQDPLVNEGASNDGRRSRNVRIVTYDVATGAAGAQFIYQLESIADINLRTPDAFGATSQGRNIGLSAIHALSDTEFLVIERDNRGFGEADPTGTGAKSGSKRVFLISLAGATDVQNDNRLEGTNALPADVVAVKKSLYFDVLQTLIDAGFDISEIPEKLEGLTIGPQLADGRYLILMGTDNDFSVTQPPGAGPRKNVCTDGFGAGASSTLVDLEDACPEGLSLIPGYLYAFAGDLPVPAPASLALLAPAVIGLAAARRRRG